MALEEALATEFRPELEPDAASGSLASWVRVFAAGQRLSGWVTYGRLVTAARWVQHWTANPPVDSGIIDVPHTPGGPDEPDAEAVPEGGGSVAPSYGAGDAADEALRRRLDKRAAGYERRYYRTFGYPGTHADWVEELAEPLVASELAVACGLPPTTARLWVRAAVAVFVDQRLPGLVRLLAAGWVEWSKVDVFVRETNGLPPALARAVDAVVLGPIDDPADDIDVVDVLADPAAPGSGVPVVARWTAPQLQDAIRAAILELDKAAADRRSRENRAKRHVRVGENPDGTAELIADLPAEDAAAVFASLTAAAKAAKAAGDPRTIDQLRADELVHRATRGVTPTETQANADLNLDSTDDSAADGAADSAADPSPDSSADSCLDPDDGSSGARSSPVDASSRPVDMERCACGRRVPIRFVPSFTAEHAGPPVKSMLVSLTMPLSTFLGLADQPGRLDGYGPIAAGLARRIAADAAKEQPGWTVWRCVVTDDVHGTVLGVTDPIQTPVWTPRHDPPPRLTRLVTAMEPVCVFPGCRMPARPSGGRCEIDHRIPYDHRDPDRAGGEGRTCSCNLQPLCKTHHQQKTAGALTVRAVDPGEGRGGSTVPLGTLEWTLPSGVTCRSHPHIAAPAPIPTDEPHAAPAVSAALRHLENERARIQAWRDTDPDAPPDDPDADPATADNDWAQRAYANSRARAAQTRADQAARAAAAAERVTRLGEDPPF